MSMMTFFTPGDFHYDPEDDKLQAEFFSGLKRIKSNFNPLDKSWDVSRLDAFRNALEREIMLRLPKSYVTFEYKEDKERFFQLVITIVNDRYGKLSTSLAVEMIRHADCPRNLPQLVASEFAKEIKKPR